MKKIIFPSLLTLVFIAAMFGTAIDKTKNPSKAPVPSRKKDSITEVRILFAGDVMAHLPQIDAARTDSSGSYDFGTEFQYVSPLIKKADIAVVNLETTFGGKPFSGYPQFSAPDTLAWFLKYAGFNLIADANNHAADRGTNGILGTIKGLDDAGLAHTGTFRDSAERAKLYPYIVDKKGIKLAFLNYTYGTNGLVVHPPVIVNYIDTTQIKSDIQTAKSQKPDAIIVFFHWGIEYQRQPNADQQKIARFCLAHGIDVVIGSHPHVVQPAVWETYRRPGDTTNRKGLVLYSLGNFVSNQRQPYTDGGIMFSFSIRKNKHTGAIRVVNPAYEPTWVYIAPRPVKYYILPAAGFEQDSTLVQNPVSRAKMLEAFKANRIHMRDGNEAWLNEMK